MLFLQSLWLQLTQFSVLVIVHVKCVDASYRYFDELLKEKVIQPLTGTLHGDKRPLDGTRDFVAAGGINSVVKYFTAKSGNFQILFHFQFVVFFCKICTGVRVRQHLQAAYSRLLLHVSFAGTNGCW